MAAEASRSVPGPRPSAFHAHGEDRPSSRAGGGGGAASQLPLVVDCDRCAVRGLGCGDCVVTVLLGGPPYGVELDDEERRAIKVLADAGLVPPLRMVEATESRHPESP